MARKLEIEIIGDASSFSKALGQAEGDTKGFSKGLKTAAKVGAVAFGALAAGSIVAGRKMVSMASDAAEVDSKLKIVFGKTLPGVTRQIDAFSKATGVSRFEMREQVADMGALLRPLTGTQKEAGKLSVQFTQLAADLGSFNNVPTAEALDAIRSGLVGETEPLRRFGVLLNEAAVNQEGLRLGLIKGKEALTEQEKVQARASLIMKQTTLAQGDATRTADSFANQQKRLTNTIKDTATEIGMVLIPAALNVVTWFNANWPKIRQVATDVFTGLRDAYNTHVRPTMQAIGDAIRNVARTAQQEWPKVKNAAQQVATWYSTQLKPTMQKALDDAREAHDKFGSDSSGTLRRVFAINIALFRGYFATVSGVLTAGMAVIRGDWSQAWNSLVGIVRTWRTQVGGAIDAAAGAIIGAMKGLGAAMVGGVMAGIGSMAGALRDKFVGVLRDAKDAALRAFRIRSPSQLMAQEIGVPMAQGVAAGIQSQQATVTNALKGVLMTAVRRQDFGAVSSIISSMFSAKQAAVKTPSEKRIAGIERGRELGDLRQGITDANKAVADALLALAEAQASGDPAAVAEAALAVQQAKRDEARAKQDLQLFNLREKAEKERQRLDAKQMAEQIKLGMRLEQLGKLFDKQHVTSAQLLIAVRRMLHKLGIPGFAQGGVVPGPRGAPVLATVHGGETILPTHRTSSGGQPIQVNLQVDGTTLARVLVDPLRRQAQIFERNNGRAAF